MNDIVLYIKESYNELIHKVTWPSMPELLASTRLVLVASVLIALVIFIMDSVSNGLTSTIYDMFGN